jgi:hypothetical protein
MRFDLLARRHAVHRVSPGRAARRVLATTGAAFADAPGPLPTLRLRLPRHARALPGMWHGRRRAPADFRLTDVYGEIVHGLLA